MNNHCNKNNCIHCIHSFEYLNIAFDNSYNIPLLIDDVAFQLNKQLINKFILKVIAFIVRIIKHEII